MAFEDARAMIQNVRETLGDKVCMDEALRYGKEFAQYLPRHQRENGFEEISEAEAQKAARYARDTAWRETDKATYQAMEALVHNLNTMNSRAGAQVPFSSLNYGTDHLRAGPAWSSATCFWPPRQAWATGRPPSSRCRSSR